MNKYTLSDDVIAAIARLVQLAMFTKTDVVDHLRLLEVEPDGTQLKLTSESRDRVERNVQDLLFRADQLRSDSDSRQTPVDPESN